MPLGHISPPPLSIAAISKNAILRSGKLIPLPIRGLKFTVFDSPSFNLNNKR